MRKIEFSFSWGWNDYSKEIFEYEDDVTQEEIDNDYEEWLWNLIGDRCCTIEVE